MFHEYDVVRLIKEKDNIPSGESGTVLIVYDYPNKPKAYEVEFMDEESRSYGVVTVYEDEIELVVADNQNKKL